MELVLRGALSTKDREYIMGFHSGHTIAEVIDKLYKDGHTLRLKADDLRHLTYVITEMKKEKDRV
ncbi:hypothetical protein ACM5ME_20600 [Bacillus subtilis]|uniref:hypothetical protein n=1 Tax=Bacillus subtilis TaxID=1423 RepID=UPI003AAF4D23